MRRVSVAMVRTISLVAFTLTALSFGYSTHAQVTCLYTRDLTVGSSGEDVRQLQRFLNSLGYQIAESGPGSPGAESTYFGTLTQQALVAYQSAYGITPANGYFGSTMRSRTCVDTAFQSPPMTMIEEQPQVQTPSQSTGTGSFSGAILRIGLTHPDVRVLQQMLNAKGYQVAITGPGAAGSETNYFGALTELALKRYQCAALNVCSGTPQTTGYGQVGPLTRTALAQTTSQSTIGIQTTHQQEPQQEQEEDDVDEPPPRRRGGGGGGGGGGTTPTPTPDTTAPSISSIAISPDITTATITWTTNEAADSQLAYGTTAAYGATTTLDSTLVTSHTINLTGLSENTTYHFRVRSADNSGNTEYSNDQTFTTASVTDTTAPTISSMSSGAPGQTTATITWTTNEAATSRVSYGTSSGIYTNASSSSSLVTSHAVSFVGLSASTLYYYIVISTDASGNTATSSESTFTTESEGTDLTSATGSLRFPENNHETTVDGTYGALYQPTTNFPNLFSTDGSFFVIARIPLDRMHDNRLYRMVGATSLSGGRTFAMMFYGSDFNSGSLRSKVVGMMRGTAGTTVNVTSEAVSEQDVLLVFKRDTNESSVDFTVDWYSLDDGTKHAGTPQTGVTTSGMSTYVSSYFGIGVGHAGTLPSSGSKSTARTNGEFPGELQAIGYVTGDVADATWQSIALGSGIIPTLGASNLPYLREFDGTSASYAKPAGATADLTNAAVAVDGDNLSPGSTIRRQNATNYLTIDYLPAGKVFALTPGQNSRSVPFSGKVGGYTGDIEMRLIYADTGAVHKDWTTVGSASDGMWSGSMTVNRSANGWLIAQARPVSTPSVISEMREPFGVGYKFGLIGQSQMQIALGIKSRGDKPLTPFKISVSMERQYEITPKKEKLFRLGPHPSSDAIAYFARQWDEYGDNTPVELVSFAESGTSARDWADDTDEGRNWSDTDAIVDYVGSDFTGLIWQWGTSDNVGSTYGTDVLDGVVKGVGPGAADHYLEDGITFDPGFEFGLGQYTRHGETTAGPYNVDQYGIYGDTRDSQIAWVRDNSYTLGPSFSDLELVDNNGPHQSESAFRGDPLMGVRLAMTAARIVGIDTATDPAVNTAQFTDGTKNAISVSFTLPNGGSLTTNGHDTAVWGFEISDDSGSTWSRAGFTTARSANTVILTKSSGSWAGGGVTRVRYLYGGPLAYGSSTNQTDMLDGLLYETYAEDALDLGLPVMGSNTGITVQ